MKKLYKQLRFILIFIPFAIGLQPASAQVPPWDWAVSPSGPCKWEYMTSVAAGNNGVYVTGYFDSAYLTFGTDTLFNTNPNENDAFWARYDRDGNLLWAKSAEGLFDEDGTAVAVDGFGNVIYAGNFNSDQMVIEGDTLFNHNPGFWSSNVYVAKFDSSGTLLWARSFGSGLYVSARGMTIDGAGNIYLTGEFDSDTLFLDGHYVLSSVNGWIEGYLAKLDPQGNGLWVKGMVGDNSDYSSYLNCVQNNSILVAGFFSGDSVRLDTALLINHGGSGSWDIFLARYDSSGALIWANSDGGTGDDMPYGVLSDTAGNITLCGNFQSNSLVFGSALLQNRGSADIMILHYDGLGNRDTAWQAGGAGYDAVNVAVRDAKSGDYYLTGNFDSDTLLLDSIALTNPGEIYRMYLAKFDSQDHVQWVQGFNSTEDDEAWSASVDVSGNLYLGGSFSSPTLAFGTNILSASVPGDYDGFLAKLDTLNYLRVKNIGSNDHSFVVYPNPTTGIIHIESLYQAAKVKMIQVFDIQGKLLYQEDANPSIRKNRWQIEIKDASPGMYFLKLTSTEGSETRKIVVSER